MPVENAPASCGALSACSGLIVSCMEQNIGFFQMALNDASIKQITVIGTAGEAYRTMLKNDFDLVIIDAPLPDDSGENLAHQTAEKNISQVIYSIDSEHFNSVSASFKEDGVLVISKPIDKYLLQYAVSLAKSVIIKMKHMREENKKLRQKIEDIRIIDRAKCLLISYLSLTEHEAHKFIEKQSMELRSTKRIIAEEIIKTYAN